MVPKFVVITSTRKFPYDLCVCAFDSPSRVGPVVPFSSVERLIRIWMWAFLKCVAYAANLVFAFFLCIYKLTAVFQFSLLLSCYISQNIPSKGHFFVTMKELLCHG